MTRRNTRDHVNRLQRERYKVAKEDRQSKSRARYRAKKEAAVEHFGDVCYDCHTRYPHYVYEFHHLDPDEKAANPSELFKRSAKKMWEELEKCVMLCANCHLVRHHGGNYDKTPH